MSKNRRRVWASTLVLIVFAQGAGSEDNLYSFSMKAIQSVPDIVRRANSPDLNDRIGVLDELITRDTGSHDFHFEYAYDLPPEDYLAVASSVLEGGLFRIGDSEKVRTTFWKISEVAIQFTLSDLQPQVVGLLEHDDPFLQILTLRVLGRLGPERYIREIAKAASSSNPDVRQPAVKILLTSNSREAVPALVACLNDDNFGIRMRAVEALGRIGDHSAAAHLVPLVGTPMAPWAIRALVRLDAREAVPHIKELYRSGDENSDIVLTALAYFGDEEAISQLMAELTDDSQERGSALLEALVAANARAVIPALVSALEHEEVLGGQASRGPNIVGRIMLGLARLQAKEATPVLQRYLKLAADHSARGLDGFFAARAIEALGVLRAREAVPELLPILRLDSSYLRFSAQIALARIGEPSTAESVIASLKKDDSRFRHVEVLEELANISDPNTYQALSQIELPRIESSPSEEYLRQLTAISGVKFTFSEDRPLPDEKKRQVIAGLGGPTGLLALRRVVDTLNYSASDYAVFIRDGVVRVVPVEEAFALWAKWLAEYSKNHPRPAS